MNKTDLINQLAERLDGDKKAAQAAVEGFIDCVQREVQSGRSVSISGFGVFEKRARAARTARNPRTGEAVKVKKTTVPAFRPGKYFKDVIAGTVKLPKSTGAPTSARAAAAAAKAATGTGGTARSTRARQGCRPRNRLRPRAPGPARRPPSRPRPPAPGRRGQAGRGREDGGEGHDGQGAARHQGGGRDEGRAEGDGAPRHRQGQVGRRGRPSHPAAGRSGAGQTTGAG